MMGRVRGRWQQVYNTSPVTVQQNGSEGDARVGHRMGRWDVAGDEREELKVGQFLWHMVLEQPPEPQMGDPESPNL